MNEHAVLTVSEAAIRPRISRNKAYDLVAPEALPSFRVGRAIRISNDELDEWPKRQQKGDDDE